MQGANGAALTRPWPRASLVALSLALYGAAASGRAGAQVPDRTVGATHGTAAAPPKAERAATRITMRGQPQYYIEVQPRGGDLWVRIAAPSFATGTYQVATTDVAVERQAFRVALAAVPASRRVRLCLGGTFRDVLAVPTATAPSDTLRIACENDGEMRGGTVAVLRAGQSEATREQGVTMEPHEVRQVIAALVRAAGPQ